MNIFCFPDFCAYEKVLLNAWSDLTFVGSGRDWHMQPSHVSVLITVETLLNFSFPAIDRPKQQQNWLWGITNSWWLVFNNLNIENQIPILGLLKSLYDPMMFITGNWIPNSWSWFCSRFFSLPFWYSLYMFIEQLMNGERNL